MNKDLFIIISNCVVIISKQFFKKYKGKSSPTIQVNPPQAKSTHVLSPMSLMIKIFNCHLNYFFLLNIYFY